MLKMLLISGISPLIWAAYNENQSSTEIALCMIFAGAAPLKLAWNKTAYFFACSRKNIQLQNTLLFWLIIATVRNADDGLYQLLQTICLTEQNALLYCAVKALLNQQEQKYRMKYTFDDFIESHMAGFTSPLRKLVLDYADEHQPVRQFLSLYRKEKAVIKKGVAPNSF